MRIGHDLHLVAAVSASQHGISLNDLTRQDVSSDHPDRRIDHEQKRKQYSSDFKAKVALLLAQVVVDLAERGLQWLEFVGDEHARNAVS